MGVDLSTYRARIGCFTNPGHDSLHCWAEASCLLVWMVISQLMLKLAGDVEENPGPKQKKKAKAKKEGEPLTPLVMPSQTKPSKLLDFQPDVPDYKQMQSGAGANECKDAVDVKEDSCRMIKEVGPQRQAGVISDWASWSVEEVATWLRGIGIKDTYVEALQDVEIDGELLASYDINTLREDLALEGHKIPLGPLRKIMNARDRLVKCHKMTSNPDTKLHSPGATIALTLSSGRQFEIPCSDAAREVSVSLLPDGDTVKIPLCQEEGANDLGPTSNVREINTEQPLVVRPKERKVPIDLKSQPRQTKEDITHNAHYAMAMDEDHTVVTAKGTTVTVPKRKHQVPDTIEMTAAMKKPNETFRKFDKDVGCNYCSGQFFPRGESGADASHVCHEFKLFIEAARQPQRKKERKYLNETMRFACGCLNERINGTIHFGVDDNGKITGFSITELELEKQMYCDWLSNGKEKMFDISPQLVEAARHCIREPKFVPVVTTASQEVRYVMEVDIVPSSEYCKNLMFKVALIDEEGKREKPTVYRRFKAATQSLQDQKKENEFKLKTLPGHVESLKKREQSQSSIVPSGQLLDKAKEFKKLLCMGEKTLEGFVHRILVANGPEYPKPSFDEFRDLYDFIVDIPFAAVFDFDAESTTNGLHKVYDSLMTEREDSTANIRMLEPDSFTKNTAMTSLDFYQDINFPKELCWIMSNGWIDSNSNKREEPMDLKQWTQARGRGITDAMIKYTDPGMNQDGRILMVFLLLSKYQIDIIAELFHTFCMRIGLDSLMVLTPSEQILAVWLNALQHRYKRDDLHRLAVVMPAKHIGIAVSQLKGRTYAKQCFVKCSTGINAHLDPKMKKALKDLEVLSVTQCTDTAAELKKDRNALSQLKTDSELSFYRGNKVEWWNFFFDQVAKRDVYGDLNRYINNALSGSHGRKISVIAIHHQPGAGGSTLAMHALWEFRHRCRCVVIKKSQPDGDTAIQLMKLYAFRENESDLQHCLPILALVEDVDEDVFYNFLSTLSGVFGLRDTALPACIVLYCGQTELAFQPKKLPIVHLELKLSDGEQDWFRTKFRQLEARNIPEISLEDMMSFNLFKEGFNEDYVRRTVSKYLEKVTPKEIELLSYIALLNVFLVDTSLPAHLCDTFMPGGPKWEQRLSEAANILLIKVQDSQSSIGTYRVKHPKIAEETLKQAINDRQTLSVMTENFLKCSMFKERSYAVTYLMEMTDQIFKHRTWKKTSHQAQRTIKRNPAVDVDPREEGDEERETFSALIQRIIKQEGCEAAVRVLERWYDVKKQLLQRFYPKSYHEDPMIFQQIARIYMYEEKYNDAHHWADEALSLCIKENSYLLDTKGHIYKAEFVAQINKDTYEEQRVTDIAFRAIEIFRKAQNANKTESSGFNTAPYFGELFISFSLFRLVDSSTSHDRNRLREFLLTGQDPPNFVLEVCGTYTEQLRCQVLNIRSTMDYLSEIQTIYKEDDEMASFDSEFRKLQLAKRKLQKYIEQYIKYFGEYDANPPSCIRHPADMCNWRRRKVICKNGNNFKEVFQMAKDQKFDDLREIRMLLGQNEPKTCFDLQHLIAVILALSRHESPEEAIMSYMEVAKLSEEFVQVYHDHDISRMKAFFYVTMLMWPRKEMLLEFNLSLFERYLGELSELGKSTLFYRRNQLQHGGSFGTASGFRPAKKVYFYLGKGLGLHAFIHVTHFSGDDRERGVLPFWESRQAKELLRRVNGRLIEYNAIHAVNPFNPNKPIRVQLARPERERFVSRKPVNFILGFSWSGPLAFNVLDDHVQEETPEITESIIYDYEEEAASARGGMDFEPSMGPTDYSRAQETFSPYSDACRPNDTRQPMRTYREPTGTPHRESNESTKRRIKCPECRHLWNVPSYFKYYHCRNSDCQFKIFINPSSEI